MLLHQLLISTFFLGTSSFLGVKRITKYSPGWITMPTSGQVDRSLNKLMMSSVEILMPALSSTMTEGKIIEWCKKPGDKIEAGDTLMIVESDKADMDFESFQEGWLAAILTPAGQSAAVGSPVALIAEDKADIEKIASMKGTTSASAAVTAPASTPAPPPAPVAVSTTNSALEILMPALSSTMTEGKIIEWCKKLGDKIEAGDTVMIVESDKADMDFESFQEGWLAAILTPAGQSAAVGSPVALLAKDKADIEKIASMKGTTSASAAVTAPVSTPAPVAVSASTSAPGPSSASAKTIEPPPYIATERVQATGRARAVAEERGIDLRTIKPSSPDGIITEADVPLSAPKAGATTSAHVPAPGVINATPMAKKFAAENGLDVTKIRGTGNFNRVTADDVLIAAGKKKAPVPPLAPAAAPVAAAAVKPAAPAAATASGGKTSVAATTVLDGVVAMDGMQKAVAKNMEKTLSVPVFRVSRYEILCNGI